MNEIRKIKYIKDRYRAGYTIEQIAAGLVFHELSDKEHADKDVIRILKTLENKNEQFIKTPHELAYEEEH